MSLSIRRATPADLDTIVKFNAALAWESEGKNLDPDVLRTGVQAALGDPAKGFYAVAEREGEIVGQTALTFEWSDWRNGWYWWIQSVFVRSMPGVEAFSRRSTGTSKRKRWPTRP